MFSIWINEVLGLISQRVAGIARMLTAISKSQARIEASQLSLESNQLGLYEDVQKIIAMLTPPPPVGLELTFTSQNQPSEEGESFMGKMKVGLDFTFLDSGQATGALSLIDSMGLKAQLPAGSTLSVPTWTCSDPGIVVTPAADGLTANLKPATPPVLVTGAVITVSGATMTNADGTTVALAAPPPSQPIDVVAGGPAGFSLALS